MASARPVAYLTKPINLKDALSPEGVVFEVDHDDALPLSDEDENHDYFGGEENLADLYLGLTDKDKMANKSDWINMSFEEIASTMKALTQDDGVLKKIVKEGYGSLIPPKSCVTIHYNAFLEKQAEPFDSSRLRNQPLRFNLGDGGVVQGIDEGVASMRQGEFSEFLVKSEYGYGKMGCPPRIPPETTIFFVIEVLSFYAIADTVDEHEGMAADEQRKLRFNKVMTTAKGDHMVGNEMFKEGNYSSAKGSYKRALRALEDLNLADETQEGAHEKMLIKLHLNLAQCHLFLKEPKLSAFHCKRVIEMDSRNAKALYRAGKATRIIGEFEQARSFLHKALKLEPKDPAIALEIKLNERDFKLWEEREKEFCKKMFVVNEDPKEEKIHKVPSLSENLHCKMKEALTEFLANEEFNEYPICCGYTDEEIAGIAKIGQELGLECEYPVDCDTKLKLIKKKPE